MNNTHRRNNDVDLVSNMFEKMTSAEQDHLLKQLLLKCTAKQLQMLHNDTRQMLAVDFVILLPREIVDRIFSYLTPVELSRAACCSSQWRERANSNSLWRDLARRRSWLHFGDENSTQTTQELYMPTPAVNHTPSASSPTFQPFVNTLKDLIAISEWKDVYIRADHLHRNWEYGRYVLLPPLRFHTKVVTCADTDGCLLASGSQDKTVAVWDMSSGKQLHGFVHHAEAITCLKLSGNILLTGSFDGIVKVYNVSTGKCLGNLEPSEEIPSPAKCVSLNELYAFVAYDNYSVSAYKLASRRCLWNVKAHTDDIVQLMCNRDYCVTTSWDQTIKVWYVENGRCFQSMHAHTEVVHCCKFNNEYLVSGGGDKLVKIWELENGYCLQTLYGHLDDVYCLDFDDKHVASGSADSTVRIWSWLGICLHVLNKHVGVVRCLKLQRNMVISSGDQKLICVWDTKDGKLLNVVHRNPSLVKLMLVCDTKLVVVSPDTSGSLVVLSYW